MFWARALRGEHARLQAEDRGSARDGGARDRGCRFVDWSRQRSGSSARAGLCVDDVGDPARRLATSTDLEFEWRVLEGAGIVTAPVVASDGTLFVTTGRGPGTAHLHAFHPSGSLLWESAVQRSAADLDSGAVLSAPVLGEDGGVYVGDSNQFFAFHPDGRIRWVAELSDYGAEGPFVTGIIVGPNVGGITVHGQVLLFEHTSGVLAAPVLELPGGASPVGLVPDFAWQGGLIDAALRATVFEVLLGYRFEVTNTPAVHADSQRIFLMAAGRTIEEGAFYGIDLVEGELRIAFETKTAPGSGTSPAISPGGTRVYAYGGSGELIAFDASTGDMLYEQSVQGQQASPTVGPDDAVYVLAENGLAKVDGATGEIAWTRNYDEFAREKLPDESGWNLFASRGERVARVDSVATVTPNAVWTTLLCGYQIKSFGKEFIHARKAWLVAVDPGDGDILASYRIPDTSDGAISVGSAGEIYLDILALQASIAAYGPHARFLPKRIRTPAPRGGLVAFGPRSRTAQFAVGLVWAGDLLASGPIHGPSERLEIVRTQLRAAQWVGLGYEVSPKQAGEVGGAVGHALDAIERCAEGDRGEMGCASLSGHSRELRLHGRALQRDAEAPAGATLEKAAVVRDNMAAR